jgi:integrase
MNTVQPIRNIDAIEKMKHYLRHKSMGNDFYRMRNYFLFTFGINIGIRISDIIKLKVSDVIGSHIVLYEQKTGKYKRYFINAKLRDEINTYIVGRSMDDYLFPSKKGGYITRIQAYNIINDAARSIGIDYEVGTHTLRKTFGYWHYKQYKDVAILQVIFNHSSPSDTLRYIGIEQDQIDELASDFYL